GYFFFQILFNIAPCAFFFLDFWCLLKTRFSLEKHLLNSKDQISLVISELRLPKLSGYDLVKQIKLNTQIPVIVLSESSQKALILECIKIGVTTFLKKPTRLLALKQKVFDLLGDKKSHSNFWSGDTPQLESNAILELMKSTLYEEKCS
ncbi:response regulator, partial [bacterium]|nr:response regulator [bacterium]